MAAGLGVLGLAPRDFWAMTPAELDAALRGRFGQFGLDNSLSRSDLGALMRRFPDARPG